MLLHGYLSSKESFYYQIKFLSQYFKVTAFDFPAFGKSAPIDFGWSVGDYAKWFKNFLDTANIKPKIILAHSFGARVAFKYLCVNENGCEKLIIVGGAGLVKPRSPQYIRRVKRYKLIKKFFPKYAEKRFGSSDYRSLSPVMRESFKKIVNEDLSVCAASVKCKTLLIYGKEDTQTPPEEEGKTFNSLIKNSSLELCEGGHFCFSQHYETFNKLIYDFLTER